MDLLHTGKINYIGQTVSLKDILQMEKNIVTYFYIMLLFHFCEPIANLTKNIFAYQSQSILAIFMQILGLRRTRCMCDVSVTYLWRLHDERVAYDAMP